MLVPPPLPLKIVKHYKPRIILTNAEKLFFENLENVVNKKYSILCKVGLWAIVENIQKEGWNRIAQKHLDFVIFDKEKNTTVLIIELDDQSHNQEKTKMRDNSKDEILIEASIPFIRIKVASKYNQEELKEIITVHR